MTKNKVPLYVMVTVTFRGHWYTFKYSMWREGLKFGVLGNRDCEVNWCLLNAGY